MQRWMVIAAVLLIAAVPAQYQPETPIQLSDYTVREDLAAAGDLATAERVIRFVQVSDAHIIDDDAPYPMRQEPLDQFGPPFEGAARPHEEYTDEVLNAAIQTINAIHAEDALDFVLNTGDNIDNQLENELMRFIDNWEGTTTNVGPISGFECVPDGQSANLEDDGNDVVNDCTSLPPSVADNNTPLADGLPWFSAFGNHDGLIQGNVPVEPSFEELANEFGRSFLTQEQYVEMHFQLGKCIGGAGAGSAADDNGHGYGFAGDRLCDENPDNDGYYGFDFRGVKFLVLDTVNDDFVTANENLNSLFNAEATIGNDIIGGYAEGAIDPVQYEWLLGELDGAGDSPVILLAHHTVNSMFSKEIEGNCLGGNCLDQLLSEAGYVTGPTLTAELASRDNVLAFIGGHTHRHRIEAKTTGDGGFWNIETSSLVDHPQEARVIELWTTSDGKWFLKTDAVTHDFDLAADIAAADPHLAATAAGAATDQTVILWLDRPSLTASPQPELARIINIKQMSNAAQLDEPFTLEVMANDLLRDTGLMGLNVSLGLGYTSGVQFVEVLPAGTPVMDQGNGSYTITFTPSKLATHYATVHATDPTGAYSEDRIVMSISVEGEPPTRKKSPSAAWLLMPALVAAFMLRRP